MKIAFTTKGTEWDSMMDPRLGRTEFILLYDDETGEFSHYDNRAIEHTSHGAGPQTVQKLFELNPDILITGNGPGGNAAAALRNAPMKIYIGAGEKTVKEALSAYKNGELMSF
jgi:predicted Fe-Mo cluster-binding NifX family protein